MNWRVTGAYYTNLSETWEVVGTADAVLEQLQALGPWSLVVWEVEVL
jgi:hypothetical protein